MKNKTDDKEIKIIQTLENIVFTLMVLAAAVLMFILWTFVLFPKNAEAYTNAEAVRAIIGESSDQGTRGMLAVACGIRNRKTLKGVYGLNAKHIDKEPAYVWERARKAWEESEHNRIHAGTHWGSKTLDKKWIARMQNSGMQKAYEYKDHVFYKEVGAALAAAEQRAQSV